MAEGRGTFCKQLNENLREDLSSAGNILKEWRRECDTVEMVMAVTTETAIVFRSARVRQKKKP
jgi:hypothetical protein